MTSSKVFLGVSASLLAVAAFAASKTNFSNRTIVFTQTTATTCTSRTIPSTTLTTHANVNPYKLGAKQTFTKAVGTTIKTCESPLYLGE